MRPYVDQAEFDVVIIGSGIAGALAAHRLAEAGRKVLILEAGGVAPNRSGGGRWRTTSSPHRPNHQIRLFAAKTYCPSTPRLRR